MEVVGRETSGDTVTRYGLDGPGIESRLGRAAPVQPGSGAHPASCTMGKVKQSRYRPGVAQRVPGS